MTDTQATIAALWMYPIKSCAGISLLESPLTTTGLAYDRAWMVVDAEGKFVTQRQLPQMTLIQPQMRLTDMVLRAPGMLALHVGLNAVEAPTRVQVWRDELPAYDMGAVASQWFTDFLGQTPEGKSLGQLRLVRFDPEQQRLSDLHWTQGVRASNQFADGFPLLLTTQASLDELNLKLVAAQHAGVTWQRFRPNVVLAGLPAHDEDHLAQLSWQDPQGQVVLRPVKPCPRCPIPNIDPATAQSSPQVAMQLAQYRQDARLDGAISFGMNTIIVAGVSEQDEPTLRVGQLLDLAYAV